MTMVRRLFLTGTAAVWMMAAPLMSQAQDKVEATIGADLVSKYIWRGQPLGDVSVQPTLGLACRGLSLTAFGNVGLSDKDDTEEMDFTLAYATGGLHVGLTDYWFSTPSIRYFDYAAHSTSHVFEANVGYDFGPVAFDWYTNFAGNDGLNPDGNRAYSSYAELRAPFRSGSVAWTATMGVVPYATTFYADAGGFAVVNVALRAQKDIRVTDSFALPVFATVAANPSSRRAYFVCGITLRP